MNMTPDEYVTELIIECKNDFEQFWERNIYAIKDVDISNIRIMAFHVVGSLDGCREIKSKGLMNLQEVLSSDTAYRVQMKNSAVLYIGFSMTFVLMDSCLMIMFSIMEQTFIKDPNF